MTGAVSKHNPTKARKRVDAENDTGAGTSMIRAKDGSAFARCDECKKDVPVALITFHNCGLDAKIKTNLESQVTLLIEAKKPIEKRKESKVLKTKKPKKEKSEKDPNLPKRPPTAFFLFMDDFRKGFKEANPDCKDVKKVAKEGGEKWKSMTDEEKKLYTDKASVLKAEYDKTAQSKKAAKDDDREVNEVNVEQ